MLKKRIITALILILFVLLILFFLPPISFFYLTAFITLIAAWEWTYLMEMKSLLSRFIYLALMIFVAILVTKYIPISLIFDCTFVWWLVAIALIITYPMTSKWWAKPIYWRGFMGMMVLIPCWVAINYIRNLEYGIYTLLFLLILICSADSSAYFVGRKWGKHPLASRVSPKKSVEGFLAAITSTMIITVITLLIFQTPKNLWLFLLLISVMTVLFSIVGDLFESMIKREANLKDSSQLLPGHGGLLDRIDSLTAAAPIFVWSARLIGHYMH